MNTPRAAQRWSNAAAFIAAATMALVVLGQPRIAAACGAAAALCFVTFLALLLRSVRR